MMNWQIYSILCLENALFAQIKWLAGWSYVMPWQQKPHKGYNDTILGP